MADQFERTSASRWPGSTAVTAPSNGRGHIDAFDTAAVGTTEVDVIAVDRDLIVQVGDTDVLHRRRDLRSGVVAQNRRAGTGRLHGAGVVTFRITSDSNTAGVRLVTVTSTVTGCP
jgi:hypothetical protein